MRFISNHRVERKLPTEIAKPATPKIYNLAPYRKALLNLGLDRTHKDRKTQTKKMLLKRCEKKKHSKASDRKGGTEGQEKH